MSELNVYHHELRPDEYAEFYLKYEADKVIAELEEKLKNSRNARKYWRKEYLIEYKEAQHDKYKRCLAMARWCLSKCSFIFQKSDFYCRWYKKWSDLAQKFKEAK